MTLDDFQVHHTAAMRKCCLVSIQRVINNAQRKPSEPIALPCGISADDGKALVSDAVWSANIDGAPSAPVVQWALRRLAQASGCRFWDRQGIHYINDGTADSRLVRADSQPNAKKQFILVSFETLNSFRTRTRDTELERQLSAVQTPFDLIFTFAGPPSNISERWVAVTVGHDKRVVVRHADQGAGINGSLFITKLNTVLKGSGKKAGNCSFFPLKSASESPANSDLAFNLSRTATILFGGIGSAGQTPTNVSAVKLWLFSK